MTILGTSHFVSLQAAKRYYRAYGFDQSTVNRKVREGEISIGIPDSKPGERVVIIDSGTRYALVVPDKPEPEADKPGFELDGVTVGPYVP